MKKEDTKKIEDIAVEKAVLGAILLDSEAMLRLVKLLKAEHFSNSRHKEIYQTLLGMFEEGEDIDLLTIVNNLRKNGNLNAVGGPGYLIELTENITSTLHIEAHAKIIISYAVRRGLLKVGQETSSIAQDNAKNIEEALDKLQKSFFEITTQGFENKSCETIGDVLQSNFKILEENSQNKTGVRGTPTGFKELDKFTGGWQDGSYIILAGRPGKGKTALALKMLANVVTQTDDSAVFFSLEMCKNEVANRLISMLAEINLHKLNTHGLASGDWMKMYANTAKLAKSKLFIEDSEQTILQIKARCRQLKAQHNIKLIVVDYLQLLHLDAQNIRNREQEICKISYALKSIAKELKVPLIALSQLSRAVEVRGGEKRPHLSDLRESGSIEQDADIVMMLYRGGYYNVEEDTGDSELIFRKNRNGPLGTVKLTFKSEYTKFVDFEGFFSSSEEAF